MIRLLSGLLHQPSGKLYLPKAGTTLYENDGACIDGAIDVVCINNHQVLCPARPQMRRVNWAIIPERQWFAWGTADGLEGVGWMGLI